MAPIPRSCLSLAEPPRPARQAVGPDERAADQGRAPTADLEAIAAAIVTALDADRARSRWLARSSASRRTGSRRPPQLKKVQDALLREAAKPIAEAPPCETCSKS